MFKSRGKRLAVLGSLFVFAAAPSGCGSDETKTPTVDPTLAAQGKDIFRFDTFGDETFWTDTLRMNEVIAAAVDPTTALSVGLKVDAEALAGRRWSRASRTAAIEPDQPGDDGRAAQARTRSSASRARSRTSTATTR